MKVNVLDESMFHDCANLDHMNVQICDADGTVYYCWEVFETYYKAIALDLEAQWLFGNRYPVVERLGVSVRLV